MTVIASTVFPRQAAGSLLEKDGQIIGSGLIGQNFVTPGYFHSRPSEAGDAGYDASASSGSNLGPTSQKLMKKVNERLVAVREENSLRASVPVPSDAVLASSSGLDPHISPAYAYLQADRVAKARSLPVKAVESLSEQHLADKAFGIFGEPTINVVKLNIALDDMKP
jgi:K+-transporting ATPase ATPase C chain